MTTNDKKNAKKCKKYSCEICSFITENKYNYNTHLLTAKHKMMTNDDNQNAKKCKTIFECNCGNIYKYRQGLFNHKLKCSFTHNSVINECTVLTTTNNNSGQVPLGPTTKSGGRRPDDFGVNTQNQSNNELLMVLLKQNNELQKQVIEMAKEPKTVNNNNTNNNIQLNLHQFLNESCKNAPNFSEFIDNIQVSYDDLDNNVKLGFVDGMTQVIVKHLKQLALSDRPIHCTDVKRETIYVKEEDQWEKENSKETIQRGIQEITRKNMCQLIEWREDNPEYEDMDSELGEKSMVMQQNLMAGGKQEKFYLKIIKNIAKETILDKKQMLE